MRSCGDVKQVKLFRWLLCNHLHAHICMLGTMVIAWYLNLIATSVSQNYRSYQRSLDYHKIKKWLLAKLREIYFNWQLTTFNKTRTTRFFHKKNKNVERHQGTGPCPPYSAFPQVTTRASPRRAAKAPADAEIWRTSTSCWATLLQSWAPQRGCFGGWRWTVSDQKKVVSTTNLENSKLGEENSEDLGPQAVVFARNYHANLLESVMKKHLVMCQLTWNSVL